MKLRKKADIKIHINKTLNHAIDIAKERLIAFEPIKQNPQVALMIEKNKGYIMAMEDIRDTLQDCGLI